MVSWEVWEKSKSKNTEKPGLADSSSFTKFKDLSEFLPVEEKLASERSFLKRSMFPSDAEFMKKVVRIENSMRILPHDQNTGGFYVALFRKLKPIVLKSSKKEKTSAQEPEIEKTIGKEEEEQIAEVLKKLQAEEDNAKQKNNKNKENNPKNKGYPNQEKKKQKIEYKVLEGKDWDWIQEFYGIKKEFPKENLIFSGENGPKKIIFVTSGIKNVLEMDRKSKFVFFFF